MRVRVSVLGHFGEGKNLLNGQTVKTKIVTEELQNQLGQDQVLRIDTHGGWKTLLKAPFQVFRALKTSANVIIFPAHNGLRVYAPLLSFIKRFFKKRKIHYVVIGGWLAGCLEKKSFLRRSLKKFDFIYVETTTMKHALEELGFENIVVMPNCKKLTLLEEEDLKFDFEKPYKICTFSRVMKEKGIEDAVDAVRKINEDAGNTVYELDIFGQIESEQQQWFDNLQKSFPEFVKYRGQIPFDKSVDVIREYYILLFPTRFFTEGIPGTVIDSYASGVPVIASRWESFFDIVDEGVTGYGYEFGNTDEFTALLTECYRNPDKVFSIKQQCLKKGKQFLPERAVEILIKRLGEV